MSLRLRGLDLSAQVDFSNTQRGEVTIVTPFRQTLRLDARVRVVPPTAPTVEHPMVRARRWHQMLETGRVPHRLALATLVGVDPAMVTRTLKLNQLAPEIQAYLVALKTPSGIWHFNLKTLCAMPDLSLDAPRAEFAKLLGRYNRQSLQQRARIKTVPIVPAKPTLRTGPRLSAG